MIFASNASLEDRVFGLEQRVAALEAGEGYLDPAGAARYLGLKRKRIYDLKSARVLEPDGHDGRTPLFKRETLDNYVRSGRR